MLRETVSAPDPRVEQRALFVLVLAAFAVRLGISLVLGIHTPPPAWGDDNAYDAIARAIAFSGTYDDAWFPPGYPLVLAGLYSIFGAHLEVVRVVQALVGAFTCLLVYRLGKCAFGPAVAWLAAIALALLPGHAYMTWRIMAETIYIFLLTASAWLALEFMDRADHRRAILLGLTLGLANAFKSNLIVFPMLLIAAVGLVFVRRHPVPVRAWLALVAAFALASTITPIGNLVASGGKTSLLPANAGHTLFFANNPEAHGYFADLTGTPYAEAMAARLGYAEALAKADARDKDRIYLHLALAWIRENPGAFAKLCGQKLANAFGPLPTARVLDGNRGARALHLVTFGAVMPLALAGMVLARRRVAFLLPLYLVLASYTLMVLVFYGTPRFTLIVMPCLLLFAAVAIVRLGGLAMRQGTA